MTWISIKEALINRVKNTNDTNDIKKLIDNIGLKEYFTIFTNDKERDEAAVDGYL